jgi:hypothetical protein
MAFVGNLLWFVWRGDCGVRGVGKKSVRKELAIEARHRAARAELDRRLPQ